MKNIFYILILLIMFTVIFFLLPEFLSILYQEIGGNILSDLTGFPENESAQGFTCSSTYTRDNLDRDLFLKAIGYYQTALAYDEDDAHANLQLGRIYCYINDPQSAIQHYNRSIELRPNNPLGYLELGFAYEALFKECGRTPECKSSTDNREAMLSAWEQSEVRYVDFLQAGDEQRRRLEFSSAQEWYERGFLFNDLFRDEVNQYPDYVIMLENFATSSFWIPCRWCENVNGTFTVSDGVLEMSYRNNLDKRDKFGYRLLQRILLEDNNNLVLRVKGDTGTLITLEVVIDDERVRLISYQPVYNFWETLVVPIGGDVFEEVTIIISELDALSKIEYYRINIDWIGFK